MGLARVVMSSMSPIMIPPAGVAGGELAGADGVRSTSAMVLAIGGSFTFGFELGCGEAPPAPTGSNASLGFSTGGGAACGRFPGEAGGGGGTTAASILGGSMGAGTAGVGTGAGSGARKRGACGTGAGGAALRTSRSFVIFPRLGSRWVRSFGTGGFRITSGGV